jgi:hypothetical protein
VTETPPSTIRQLRVFRVILAAFKFCVRDFPRLFLITWFACVLASLSRLLLEWLVYPFPQLPNWMMSESFDPPTWLAPIFITPWLAMGCAFILNEMFDADPRRGIIRMPGRELSWIRFEVSGPVLMAGAILAVVGLTDGITRMLQQQILVAVYTDSLNETTLGILAGVLTIARVALMAAVFVWFYPLAGMILHTGSYSVTRLRQLMRGNWLRVAVIFFMLTVILRVLDQLLQPVTSWLYGSLVNSPVWTVQTTLVRLAIDFPFQMLWTMTWGITLGIVLHTLTRSTVPLDEPGDQSAQR